MFIWILVNKGRNSNVLFGKFVLDPCSDFFGVIRTVGGHPNIKGAEFPCGDTQAFHTLAVHEKECQILELRRRHKWMTDQTGDGDNPLLVVDFEDDAVPDTYIQELRRHSFDTNFVFSIRPAPGP